MNVTFYTGDYTRKTGKRVKGEGEQITTDSVERIRIDNLPNGDVIDRPARPQDKVTFAKEYDAFKNPPKEEKKHEAPTSGRVMTSAIASAFKGKKKHEE